MKILFIVFALVFLVDGFDMDKFTPHPTNFAAKPNIKLLAGKPLNEVIEWNWSSPLGFNTTIEYRIQHKDNLILLDQDKNVIGIYCDGSTVYVQVSNVDAVSNWTIGSVMVGGKEWNCVNEHAQLGRPLYRTIQKISKASLNVKNQVYKIETNYSTFFDCFQEVSFSFYSEQLVSSKEWQDNLNNYPNDKQEKEKKSLFFESISYNYDKSTGKAINPLTLVKETSKSGSLDIECTNCYFVFNASLQFKFQYHWDWFKPVLDIFSTIASGGFKSNIDLFVNADYLKSGGKSYQVANIPLPSIEFCIGWVPVWIDINIPITVGYNYEIQAQGTVNLGNDFEGNVQYGIQYKKKWSPISDQSFKFNAHPPQSQSKLEVQLNAYVQPEIYFSFYGIGGPYLSVNPGIDSNISASQSSLCLTIGDDVNVDIGAKLTWPVNINSGEIVLYKDSHTLYSKCF